MLLLDTNICIYVLKERPLSVLQKFENAIDLGISSIVYAELWSGIEKSPVKVKQEREDELLQFLTLLDVHEWGESAARVYARVHTELKKTGNMIGNMDLLIAAHAKSLDAILVTNNVREFNRVDGLRLENWV